MSQNQFKPLHVAVSGASGLIGRALCESLRSDGNRVSRLVRLQDAAADDEIPFLPDVGRIDAGRLEGLDAVIHLAGEGIANGRWSAERMRRIRDSRVLGTRLLATALARLESKPEVLVNASAIGFYGERGDEKLDESSPPGSGFLPETCVAWEAETAAAKEAAIRVVRLRFGVVLSAEGGALAKMLPTFRLGLGGRIGDGRQFMSWVTRGDAVGMLRHILDERRLSGPVNAVAPAPVRNADFTRILAHVLRRPALFPVPALAIRTAFGQMGNDLLLASTRVYPRRLEQLGYPFADPELEAALRFELGKV